MKQYVYKYSFSGKLPIQDIEDSLLLAVLATECLHGRSLIRLDASFNLDKKERCCVIDANTEVGCHIARIFTGFLTREFGEDSFRIKRLDDYPIVHDASENDRDCLWDRLRTQDKRFSQRF